MTVLWDTKCFAGLPWIHQATGDALQHLESQGPITRLWMVRNPGMVVRHQIKRLTEAGAEHMLGEPVCRQQRRCGLVPTELLHGASRPHRTSVPRLERSFGANLPFMRGELVPGFEHAALCEALQDHRTTAIAWGWPTSDAKFIVLAADATIACLNASSLHEDSQHAGRRSPG
jgi:hypothetical protein